MTPTPRDPRKTGSIVLSILLVLAAMLLPVCHLHPLLDKGAPDHCAICVSLHAAAPLAAQAPGLAAPEFLAERVDSASPRLQARQSSRLSSSRAPPERPF
jgi:hypothetical protein